MCFLYENISTCSFTRHVFSPFSAHFYPPLHHTGKGSIPYIVLLAVSFFCKNERINALNLAACRYGRAQECAW